MIERWKPCPGHEWLYEVSDAGRVRRSARGKATFVGRIIKLIPNSMGYLRAPLTIEGKTRLKLVHVLVCEAFVGPRPPDRPEAAHSNGVHTDNRWDNLTWKTHSENMQDKNLHGTHNKGEAHKRALLKDEDIPNIRKLLSEKMYQKDIAKMYGVHRCTINNIAQGINWTHVPMEAQ